MFLSGYVGERNGERVQNERRMQHVCQSLDHKPTGGVYANGLAGL